MYSIWKKRQKKGTAHTIYDVKGLRICLPRTELCYAALGIIHNRFIPLPGRIKDYIASPKQNGYQSLHTTVFTGDGGTVEIQIRTPEMHERAEWGVATHEAYKENNNGVLTRWFRRYFPAPRREREENPALEEKIKKVPQWIQELIDPEEYVTLSNIGNERDTKI